MSSISFSHMSSLGYVSPISDEIRLNHYSLNLSLDAVLAHERAHKELIDGTSWGFIEGLISTLASKSNVPEAHRTAYELLLLLMNSSSFNVHEGVATCMAHLWYIEKSKDQSKHVEKYLCSERSDYYEAFKKLSSFLIDQHNYPEGNRFIVLLIGTICLNRPLLKKFLNWSQIIEIEKFIGINENPDTALEFIYQNRDKLIDVLNKIAVDYQNNYNAMAKELHRMEYLKFESRLFEFFKESRMTFYQEIRKFIPEFEFLDDQEAIKLSSFIVPRWKAFLKACNYDYMKGFVSKHDYQQYRHERSQEVSIKRIDAENVNIVSKPIEIESWLKKAHNSQLNPDTVTIVKINFPDNDNNKITYELWDFKKDNIRSIKNEMPSVNDMIVVYSTQVDISDAISFPATVFLGTNIVPQNGIFFLYYDNGIINNPCFPTLYGLTLFANAPVLIWIKNIKSLTIWLELFNEINQVKFKYSYHTLLERENPIVAIYSGDNIPVLILVMTKEQSKIINRCYLSNFNLEENKSCFNEESIVSIIAFYLMVINVT